MTSMVGSGALLATSALLPVGCLAGVLRIHAPLSVGSGRALRWTLELAGRDDSGPRACV